MADYKYHVKVPTTQDWRDMVKCQAGCPVLTDSRGYVLAAARGDLETAYNISHDPNPLSTVCGRICGAPCEVACRRGFIESPDEKPVSIRAIKRILTERFGPESTQQLPARETATDLISLDTIGEMPGQTFARDERLNPGNGTLPGNGPKDI